MLSIIVPVYNVEKYLRKCIESILNQSFTNFELILVNDGSTDSSKEICEEYLQKDSRIILLNKENGGLSSARNLGLSKATGKYVALVDSDDWIDIHMYQSMVTSLENTNADIVVCGHKVVNIDGSIDEINTTKESILYSELEATKLILKDEKIFSFAWDKVYRRELFENITYPVGRIYEDTATTYKLFHKAKSILHLNKAYYYYIRRNDSLCHINDKEILRRQHNFLGFYERYLFIKNNPQYMEAFDKSEAIVLNMGLSLLHFNLKNKKLFEEEYIKDLISKLKVLDIINNKSVPQKDRIEHYLLRLSDNIYMKLLRLYFHFK